MKYSEVDFDKEFHDEDDYFLEEGVTDRNESCIKFKHNFSSDAYSYGCSFLSLDCKRMAGVFVDYNNKRELVHFDLMNGDSYKFENY